MPTPTSSVTVDHLSPSVFPHPAASSMLPPAASVLPRKGSTGGTQPIAPGSGTNQDTPCGKVKQKLKRSRCERHVHRWLCRIIICNAKDLKRLGPTFQDPAPTRLRLIRANLLLFLRRQLDVSGVMRGRHALSRQGERDNCANDRTGGEKRKRPIVGAMTGHDQEPHHSR